MRISLVIVTVLFLINLFSDIYILRQLPKNILTKVTRSVYWSVNAFIYTVFVLIIAMIYTRQMALISSNIEIIIFTLITLCFPKFLFVVISLLDYLSGILFKKRVRLFTILALVLSTMMLSTLFYGMIFGRKVIKTTQSELIVKSLPKKFDGYRIVQISDLHLKSLYGDTAFMARVVDSINALKPDMVAVTGDIVSLSADEILPFKTVLSRIKAPDGVYSVLGNHDYGDYVQWSSIGAKIENIIKLKTYQAEMGWQMLNNDCNYIVRNNDTIVVMGVENWGPPPFQQYGNLYESYPALKDEKFKILLSHNPEHWRQVLYETNIALTLSGHTHSMQLKIPCLSGNLLSALLNSELWSGLYERNGKYLYVNDGIGCTLFAFRLGAYPEITTITLKSE